MAAAAKNEGACQADFPVGLAKGNGPVQVRAPRSVIGSLVFRLWRIQRWPGQLRAGGLRRSSAGTNITANISLQLITGSPLKLK